MRSFTPVKNSVINVANMLVRIKKTDVPLKLQVEYQRQFPYFSVGFRTGGKGMLSQSEKQFLFTIARTSIEAVVSNERVETLRSIPRALREPCGAFVTLRSTGELRGCIGYVDAIKPLFETVQDAAVKAAAEDFRFEPITAAELPELEMEISILSPRKLIHNIREVEIGRDGLVVELENARGLLLPQVATEQGWDRETFYYETLRKAGIPPSARDHPGIRIFTFTAEVIHQNAPAHHTH